MSLQSASAPEARAVAVTIAYVAFAFTLGAAWFVLAPLIPALIAQLHASLSSILLFVSLYGFAMIVFSMPAAWWARKDGVSPVLRTAIVLSFVGLGGRVFAPSYNWFFLAQAVAAVAYPMLISPVGAVLRRAQLTHWRAATGLTIGMLFFGMSMGAFFGPSLLGAFGLTGTLVFTWILNAFVGVFLFAAVNKIPAERPGSGETAGVEGTRKIIFGSPRWWWIGLAIASTSVMFGGIAVSVLLHLNIPDAIQLGGTLTALTFLGSAVGASLFPSLADVFGKSGVWQLILIVLTTILTVLVVLVFTDGIQASANLLKAIFFLLGLFGNGCYALSLAATAAAAREAEGAGVHTAGFSMASNVGVALLPPLLGPLVISAPVVFGLLTIVIMAAAVVNVSINMRREAASHAFQSHP